MTKRYCIICGEEILSINPSAVFCPKHGGPKPDSRPDGQHDETVWTSDPLSGPAMEPRSNENSWQPGQVILGTYEVKERLGKGGFGTVYRVHHNTWNIDLAVKRALNLSEGSKTTFINEAEKWIDMGLHPHIISCYYVRSIDGFPHTFAELAEGKSLQDWIEGNGFSLYEGDEAQMLAHILDIAIQFAWGLAYAHERGLIHQDVKPQNALMTPEGVLKVTDFGLAKAGAQSEVGGKAETGKGFLVSGGAYTRAYCSPEQAAGLKLSIKTDIWSWGVSILEMFCGGVRWMAGQAAASALENYLVNDPEPGLPKIPDGMVNLLRQCFRNDPAERPTDMKAIASHLLEIYRQSTGQDYARKEPKAAELRADNLNNKALTMLDIGKPDAAEELLREALRLDNMNPGVTYNLSLLEWRRGDIDDLVAAGRLQQILSTSSKKWPAAFLLAQIAAERGAFQDAIEALRDVEAESEAQRLLVQLKNKNSSAGLIHTYTSSYGPIYAATFNRDGQKIITGSDKGYIEVWDISSGGCLLTWQAHNSRISALVPTPDGSRILSSSWDHTLKLHDLLSGKCIQSFEGHEKEITDIALTPDGRQAVSGGFENTIRIWNVASGECTRVLEGHTMTIKAVDISPNGNWAISGSEDKTLKVWDISTGNCLVTLSGHQNGISDVCFTSDNRHAISACGPHKFEKDNIWLWDLLSGDCIRKFNVLEYWPKALAVHPNGKWFISGGSDHILKLWDMTTGKCLHSFSKTFESLNDIAISPDGKFAVSGEGIFGDGNKVSHLWSVDGIDQIHAPYFISTPLSTEVASSHESHYLRLIAEVARLMEQDECATARQKVREIRAIPGYERDNQALQYWFDLYSKCRPGDLQAEWLENKFDLHPNEIYGCDISPDGRFALSACWDKLIRLWSTETGNLVRTFEGHTYEVDMVKFRKNGRQFLSASEDNTLRLWNIASGDCVKVYEGHTEPADCLAISPDDRFVLSGSLDSTVRLWEIESGVCLRKLETGTDFIKSVAFSPDGSRAVLGCGSLDDKKQTLQYWDLVQGECLHKFNDYAKSIWSVAISPDGSKALAGDEEGNIQLWDLLSKEILATFEGHRDEVSALAFSPNGRYFFSGGSDNILRLWDVEKKQLVRTFTMHDSAINYITFQQDGRHLLTASSDMYIHLWALDWDLEDYQTRDWDDAALPYLEAFLTIHTPFAGPIPKHTGPTDPEVIAALTREGKPEWTEEDFQQLIIELGHHGYGWLQPQGVQRKLQELADLRL